MVMILLYLQKDGRSMIKMQWKMMKLKLQYKINGKIKGVVSIAKDASKEDALAAGKLQLQISFTGQCDQRDLCTGQNY